MIVERTYNIHEVERIIFNDVIWDSISEDGQKREDVILDVSNEAWLLISQDSEVIAAYNLHAKNAVTCQIHAHVLPEHRGEHSFNTGLAVLRWLYDNEPVYQKLVAEVPVIYENVKRFVCQFGFLVEGINRLSYLKNGNIIDQWYLGITRHEIARFLNEQGN